MSDEEKYSYHFDLPLVFDVDKQFFASSWGRGLRAVFKN